MEVGQPQKHQKVFVGKRVSSKGHLTARSFLLQTLEVSSSEQTFNLFTALEDNKMDSLIPSLSSFVLTLCLPST